MPSQKVKSAVKKNGKAKDEFVPPDEISLDPSDEALLQNIFSDGKIFEKDIELLQVNITKANAELEQKKGAVAAFKKVINQITNGFNDKYGLQGVEYTLDDETWSLRKTK